MSDPQRRLDHLRKEILKERISYAGIAELQSLAEHINPSDTLLLEWAGVPEGMTPKRQKELNEIAGMLLGEEFDDTISLCVEVRKRYNDELTLAEAEYVEKQMEA